MPILEGVLIQCHDDEIRLTCSDGSISIVTGIPADVSEEGGVVLPGRLFYEVLRKLPDAELSVSMNENGSVVLRCVGSRTTIAGQNAEAFPSLPTVNTRDTLVLPQAVLRDMMNQTSFAIATDESRMVLTGCLLEVGGGEARMVAIDGFRLASRVTRVSDVNLTMSVIIPGRTISEMAKILSEDEEKRCTLHVGGNQMMIQLNGTELYSTLIEGEFIKYRQIIPSDWGTRVKIDCEALSRSVERASLMAREGKNHLIRMKFEEGTMVITANSESGDVYEELPVEIEGAPLTISFNVRYVGDVCRALGSTSFFMRFNTNVSPCLICPVEGDDYQYLILPVRLNA